MKGTQERGYILGAVDEIVLSLDDNAMNLQSMSASRYVGPFFDRVQKWEKSLSHISEVVEVSICSVHIIYMCTSLLIDCIPVGVWIRKGSNLNISIKVQLWQISLFVLSLLLVSVPLHIVQTKSEPPLNKKRPQLHVISLAGMIDM